jgi:hypothetical protein
MELSDLLDSIENGGYKVLCISETLCGCGNIHVHWETLSSLIKQRPQLVNLQPPWADIVIVVNVGFPALEVVGSWNTSYGIVGENSYVVVKPNPKTARVKPRVTLTPANTLDELAATIRCTRLDVLILRRDVSDMKKDISTILRKLSDKPSVDLCHHTYD